MPEPLSTIEVTTSLGDVYRFPAMQQQAVRSMLVQLEVDRLQYENLVLTNVSQAVLILKVRTIALVQVDGELRWTKPQ